MYQPKIKGQIRESSQPQSVCENNRLTPPQWGVDAVGKVCIIIEREKERENDE